MSSEFDLKATERAQITADAAALLAADGSPAAVYLVTFADEGSFDGPAEAGAVLLGVVPMAVQPAATSDPLEPEGDVVADVAGTGGLVFAKGMRVVIEERRYRVRHVQPFAVGGAPTFVRLQLKREYP